MAAVKQYRIEINGVQQAISEFDALIEKAEQLGRTLSGGVSVTMKSDASNVVEAQAEIVRQVEKQNEALREQKSIVQGTAGDYADALNVATSILGTYDENLRKLAEYDAKLKEIAASKKAYEKTGASADEMAALLANEMRYRQLKSETLSVIKTETKLIEAENGSYDQMNATVVRLRDALRTSGGNLSNEQFSAISAAVDDLDKKLKDADKGMGQFFRNVGNYPSAAEGFSKIKVEVAGVTREFDGLKPAILELKNAMGQLAVQGQTDTDEYKALASQMRDLQLAVATVNDEMQRSKDASGGLHDVIEMMQGFVAIGEIGQGFSQLFGLDDSALGEQIQKMTTLMGILQGLNELKNQLATGTGIGPALKKVMDVSGLSDSMKNVSAYAKELGARLHLVKPAAEGAAAGMTTFGVAARFAAESVKMLWRALLIGIAIEAVMLVIDGLVEGIKWLYNAMHDWISLSDDVERSNEAMAGTYDRLKDSVNGFNSARQREADAGLIDEYQRQADSLSNVNRQLEKGTALLKEQISLNSRNAGITPAVADWEKLGKVMDNIELSLASGNKWVSGWNDVLSQAFADVTLRLQQLDVTDEKALADFMRWANESPQVGQAIALAIKYGDDEMRSLAESIQDGVGSMYDLVTAANAAKSAMSGIDKKLRDELELRQKYGKNWQTEQRVRQSNEEVDNSGLTDGERAKLKAAREAEIRETTQHGKKLNTVRKKTANEALNIERQMQQDKLALMRDGLTKTLATIEYERRSRLDAINKMSADSKTKEQARNLANQRYDNEALEARKKWMKEYLSANEEFNREIRKQNQELAKLELDSEKSQQSLLKTRAIERVETDSSSILLSETRAILNEYGKIRSEIEEKFREKLQLQIKLDAAVDDESRQKVEDEISKLESWIIEKNEALNEVILSQKERLGEWGISMKVDDPRHVFTTWNDYYEELFNIQKYWNDKELEYQKQQNAIETEQQTDSLEKELKTNRESLSQRYENLLNDEEAIRQSGKTREEITEQYNKDMFDLEVAYGSRISEVIERNRLRNTELVAQGLEDTRKLYSEKYSSIINELNKFYSAVERSDSRLKKDNTDDWGFFNIRAFREQRETIIRDYTSMLNDVELRMSLLREDFAAGKISLGDFSNAYQELQQLEEKVKDSLGAIKGDNGMEDFIKGVDEWVQQIGQAANQILSAIFDYRNSQFDKMREDLDKQIDLVQKKYEEMEELAQKHKDAMNEIEDELSTARGDRRQHLIDALSDEIEAQRQALAEQQKAEREKQKLEKQGDKLELERKKEQKRQSLITAIINAALAISSAAANKWPVPAIPLMAIAAAVGAAQVAAISAQHYANGGLLQGPSHAQGGIKVGPNIEVEGGEYVTNKRTTAKNLELLNYINSQRRRLGMEDMMEFFEGGGGKRFFGVRGKFEDGGLMPSLEVANRVAEVVIARDDRDVVVSVVDIVNAEDNLRRVQTMAGIPPR